MLEPGVTPGAVTEEAKAEQLPRGFMFHFKHSDPLIFLIDFLLNSNTILARKITILSRRRGNISRISIRIAA